VTFAAESMIGDALERETTGPIGDVDAATPMHRNGEPLGSASPWSTPENHVTQVVRI
jgi:hypothetical protein